MDLPAMVTTNHVSDHRRRLRLAGACAMTLALAAGAIALPAAPAQAADPTHGGRTALTSPTTTSIRHERKATPARASPSRSSTARSTPARPNSQAPPSSTRAPAPSIRAHNLRATRQPSPRSWSPRSTASPRTAHSSTYRTRFEDEGEGAAAGCAVHNGNGIEETTLSSIARSATVLRSSVSPRPTKISMKQPSGQLPAPMPAASSSSPPWVTQRRTKRTQALRSGPASSASVPSTPPAT